MKKGKIAKFRLRPGKPERSLRDEFDDYDDEFREDEAYDDYDEEYDEGYEDDDYYEDDDRYEDEYEDDYDREPDEDARDAGNVSDGAAPYDDRYEDEYYRDDVRHGDDSRYDDRYRDERDSDERYEDDGRYEDDDYREDDRYDDRYEDEDYRDDDRYEDEDYRDDDRYEDDDYDDRYADDYEDGYDDGYDDDEYYGVAAHSGRGSRADKRGAKADKHSSKADKKGRNKKADKKSKKDKRSAKADKHSKATKRNREGRENKIIAFIKNTSAVEKLTAIVAIVLLAGGVATAMFYMNTANQKKQISSFAEVGPNFSEETVIGESGLIAVADAELAKQMAAGVVTNDEEDEEEEEIVPDDAEDVTINMSLTSIKSDMKIKFINSKTKKLVASVPFKVTVVNPDGSTVEYDDHDQDGIIYKKDLTAGKYKVTPQSLPSGFESYKIDTSSKTLTVKDTVEMKAVDVSNEIKKESQVNAAKEDTAVATVVESTLKDTVEYVESTKTPIGDGESGDFEKIDKSDIVDPFSTAKLDDFSFVRLAAARTPSEGNSGDSNLPAVEGVSKNPDDGTAGSSNNGSGTGSSEDKDKDKEKEPELKDINPSPSSITLKKGESTSISTSASGAKFSSSKSDVADVDSNGKVTAKGVGDATITIKADGYKDATVSVKVNEAEKKKIGVNTSDITIMENEEKTIDISEPSTAIITSGNTSVVSVDGKKIKGVAKGSTTLTVKSNNGDYEDSVSIKVTVNEADKGSMTIEPSPLTIKVEESKKLTVKGPTKDITFSVEAGKDKIVSVDKDGNVKGLGEGEATITIKAKGYNDATVKVTVTKKDTKDVPLKFKKITIVEGQSFKVETTEKVEGLKLATAKSDVAAVSDATITAKSAGSTTVTVSATGCNDVKIEVTVKGKKEKLTDKKGNPVYIKKDDKYIEATYEDYYKSDVKFYIKVKEGAKEYKYTGWQTIDGKTYYFDKNGNKVTGEQVIQGAKYKFNGDGVLSNESGSRGIDVSKWNGNIDWKAVKNSGINFVIIRCGYRGSSAGALIEDPKFKSNIKGAQAAGIKVGVYFFTQAVNEVEAVEEASMVINLIKGYSISYPVYIDVEAANGRADGISASQRTANIKAFCGTIQNAGYKAGVYANKTWFTSYINTSSITNYKIWLAQYAASVTYSASRYDMWQYTSKGKVTGISGNVDMNICY